jgi:DNA-binding MarR family transcriptional regulator
VFPPQIYKNSSIFKFHTIYSRYKLKGVQAEEREDIAIVPQRLKALGVTYLSEWDVLAFLYRHAASLCTATQIATLVGYDKAEVGAALNRLESLGLIERSRMSQGIRIYQFFEPVEPARHSTLIELMNMSQDRAGRLLLLKHLKFHRHESRRNRDSGLRLA